MRIARTFAVFTALLIAALSAGPGMAQPSAPGGNLDVEPGASFEDNNSNLTYSFGLRAVESAAAAGLGDVVLEVTGPGASMCSAHGSSAFVDFTDVGNEGGVAPSLECGRAFGQSVAVDGCKARVQAHGFMHSDHPLVNYLGPVTIDLAFHKKSATSGDLDVTVATAAGKVQLKGKVTGAVTMSTCP